MSGWSSDIVSPEATDEGPLALPAQVVDVNGMLVLSLPSKVEVWPPVTDVVNE